MDLETVITAVRSWPPDARMRLIEQVWDGLSNEGYEPELSEDLKDLLDRRIEAVDADPGRVTSWEEIKGHVPHPR